MRRRHAPTPRPDPAAIEGALSGLSAEELRDAVRHALLELDDRAHARVVNRLIDRAARGDSGWMPSPPQRKKVAEIVSFAESAVADGWADPPVVDGHLREGSSAFLNRDYAAAFTIFHALLPPVSECEIDLGQHEMVEEVLGVEVADCAAQYVVSMYMTAAPARRADAVYKAMRQILGLGHFWKPLQEMERVAIEPLPEFADFLERWRNVLEKDVPRERRGDWDTDEDRWLREVVQRTEGTKGLERIARSTKRADDLQSWCSTLMAGKDWEGALSAYEEAAESVTDREYWRGEFLDGAALAAWELGRKDVPVRLERAWREAPTMLRLRRRLGSAGSRAAVRRFAAKALKTCPEAVHRQRAFLHVVLGDFQQAAKLLSAAPGLGWSGPEHPGHLLFPVFAALLAADDTELVSGLRAHADRSMVFEEIEEGLPPAREPRIDAPGVDEILEAAGADAVNPGARKAVLEAMRKAAEKRLAGVAENKRRRHYGHAALLVGACSAVDPDSAAADWVAAVRAMYSRYPALQREFDGALRDRGDG